MVQISLKEIIRKDANVFSRVSKPIKKAVIIRVETGGFKDQSDYVTRLIIKDLQDNNIID